MKTPRIVRIALHFDLLPITLVIIALLVGMLVRIFS